jgi:hypothetical protein
MAAGILSMQMACQEWCHHHHQQQQRQQQQDWGWDCAELAQAAAGIGLLQQWICRVGESGMEYCSAAFVIGMHQVAVGW